MAVTKLDKSYESFAKGDVIVDSLNYAQYGVKVLRATTVDGVGDAFIVQYGRVKGNEWVGDKTYKGEADLTIISAKNLRSNYAGKWTKDTFSAKAGDVLKDQDGKVYVVASVDTVWSVNNGTHASLRYWEGDGKKFEHFTTGSGHNFSKYLDIKAQW